MIRLLFIWFFTSITFRIYCQNKIKHDVFFNTDSHQIIAIEESKLLSFIKSIDTINIEKISIFGFCDDRGTKEYNFKLSEQRAKTIKRFLIKHEIDSTIITNTDGKGEVLLKFINTTDTQTQRSLNRKTEIIITPKKEILNIKIPEKSNNETVKKLKNNISVGEKIILKNVLFKNGYSDILPESKKTLDEIADILIKKDNIYFTIQGHVCCTYKQRDAVDARTKKRNLSFERAKFIYNYLARKGIRKNRMKYEGLKRKFPLGGDPKFDRRVEIKITYISDKKD